MLNMRFASLLASSWLLSLAACNSNGSSSSNPTPAASPGTPIGEGEAGENASGELLTERPNNETCLAFEKPTENSDVKLERRFNGGAFPEITGFQQSPLNKRYYAIRRTGQITSFSKDDASDQSNFLDMSGSINHGPGEGGMLGMAWHPSRKDEFYLSYTVASPSSPANLKSVIARFKSADGITAANSPEILLTLDQPFENHNGGHIAFGKDGYLYIAFGDGGSGGDPGKRAQNINVLFGKILRIDVNSGAPYAIPQDNPFVGRADAKAEIYAYGLRNPWRFSFDRSTGDLWAGDVGQDKFEEIDRIQKGGNYGWNIKEATSCYNAATCANNFIEPVASYPHSEGNSVTGGFVYRGKSIPALNGVYLYADFGTGKIWGLYPDGNGVLKPKLLLSTGMNISSFAEDLEGEVYVLEYGNGFIHRFLPKTDNASAVKAPAKLSLTGCFDKTNPTLPATGLIPYEVNSPLWSDAAAKRRWMALPNDQKINVADSGHFEFPNGTVLVKEFSLENKPVETRLFIRHNDGSWAGYTYAWADDGKDADLVANGAVKTFGKQTWTYPSQGECLQCHNQNAGYSLGLEIGQLNRNFGPSGKETPQLDTFEKIGLFTKALPGEKAQHAQPSNAIDPGLAARSYMDANCAFCHRPGGTGGGNLDLRITTALKDTNLCDKAPGSGDLGIQNARLVAPGAPERSVLLARINRRGPQQMPPLASALIDQDAKTWVENWIKGLKNCD